MKVCLNIDAEKKKPQRALKHISSQNQNTDDEAVNNIVKHIYINVNICALMH